MHAKAIATTVGLDLAKNVFQVHGADAHGRVLFRKKLQRSQMAAFFAKLPPCVVAMEACGSAHHWGRKLSGLGHSVRLIAPQYVKPYVKSQMALHIVRSGLVKQRTALSNQIRGLLAEFGLVLPKGLAPLRQQLPVLLQEPGNDLTPVMRQLLALLEQQLHQLDEPIAVLERHIRQQAQHDDGSRRLQQIPGVGPITASALVASVGQARQFEDGRQMAAWLGLVPRQQSSGGKNVLLGITKRGDKYLRTLLIHGARSTLKSYLRHPERMPQWVQQMLQRKHPNVVCVAMASRTARVAWAMLTRGEDYRPSQINTLESMSA